MPPDPARTESTRPPFLLAADWQALCGVEGASSAGMLFVHGDKILHINERLARQLGYPENALAGQPLETLKPVIDGTRSMLTLNSAAGRGLAFRYTRQSVGMADGDTCSAWLLQDDENERDASRGSELTAWQAIVDKLPQPVLACARDGQLHYANEEFCRLLGRTSGQLQRHRLSDFVHRDDRARLALALDQAHDEASTEATVRMLDGRDCWHQVALTLRMSPAPPQGLLLLAAHDTSERLREQRASTAARKRQMHYMNRMLRLAHRPHANFATTLKTILKAAGKAIGADRCAYWEFDEKPAATRCVLAYDERRQRLAETTAGPLFATAFHPLLQKVMTSEHPFVVDDVDRDPRAVPACEYFHAFGIKALIAVPLPASAASTGLLIATDSFGGCAWGDDEAELLRHAGELIVQAAAAARPSQVRGAGAAGAGGCTAFFVGVDDFAGLREGLGTEGGDALLAAAAQRLRKVARKDDMLLEPDSGAFMLVARGMSDARAARDLARQIGETMADAFLLQGRELHVSAAVGLAQAPADGADLDALLQIARRRSRLGRRPAAPGACG